MTHTPYATPPIDHELKKIAFPAFILLIALASAMGAGMNALASSAIGENARKPFLS